MMRIENNNVMYSFDDQLVLLIDFKQVPLKKHYKLFFLIQGIATEPCLDTIYCLLLRMFL